MRRPKRTAATFQYDPAGQYDGHFVAQRDVQAIIDWKFFLSSFLLAGTPLGRGGRAGELDAAVLFLLGPGGSFVTGHVLSVDGGLAVR